ncbi:uncharacterized protein TNCV_1398851 [Trichonephila clavipes]|nr:uncharacterized protein TNCV_1398851 [Trichonephila clavipes]
MNFFQLRLSINRTSLLRHNECQAVSPHQGHLSLPGTINIYNIGWRLASRAICPTTLSDILICEKMETCYFTKSELDLFTTSPIQLAIDRSSFVEIHPVASISDNNTIKFLISGLGECYFDLSHLFLHVQAQILKGNGEAFQNDDKCGSINYLLNTMFAECHISLNDRQISENGIQIPTTAYTPDYAKDLYARNYLSLFTDLAQHKMNVSYDDYKENVCLYVFDLTQDKSASEPFENVTRSGDISIHLKFDADLPETATLIAYMEMPSLIEIDKSRNVFIDY